MPPKPNNKTTMKSIFKSKTAALAFVTSLAGAVSFFVPEAKDFLTENTAVVLLALGGLNFILRMVTKTGVSLFPEK